MPDGKTEWPEVQEHTDVIPPSYCYILKTQITPDDS
jgi:hypothetical protein